MSPVLPFHYVRESRKCSASPGTDRPGDNCGQTCWNHSEVVLAVPQLWFFTVREQEKLQIYFYFDTQLKAEGRGRMRCEQSRVSTMFRQVSSAVNFLKPCNTKRQKPLHCTAAGRWSRWFFFADAPSVLLETNCQNRVFQDREVYCFLEDLRIETFKP